MNHRKHNFGAGPCTLPLEVLQEAQAQFVDFHGMGMSLYETSHRSAEYEAVHNEAIALARELYATPEDFEILFIQGGATLQFSMVPMNLLGEGRAAGYVHTGSWAGKAIDDAKLFGDAYVAWDGTAENYMRVPSDGELQLRDGTRYLHVTSNETIGGIRYVKWPEVDVPLVADMSSDFFSRPIPWERFDLVYGGVQKNLAPAGMAVVFIRRSALEGARRDIGAYLRYDLHAKNDSLYNTPPAFPIYMMSLVLKWMKDNGGLAAYEQAAEEKAALLYDVIDDSGGYYNCPVDCESRSVMNIVFRLREEALEKQFLSEASAADFVGLKGHRSVGGCRASCYNAMPRSGVEALAEFMDRFRRANP